MNLYAMALLALLQQSAPVPGAGPEIRAAEARYRAAIALHPEMAAYHYSLGTVLERQQRTGEALSAYRRAVQLDSMTARHQAGLGLLLVETGDNAGAEPHLAAATRLDPANALYRLKYAETLGAAQKWTEAVEQLRQARRLDPRDVRITARLSEAEQRAGAAFQGYHDLSDFTDEPAGATVALRVLEYLIGGVLIIASAALLAPVLGTLFLLLLQAPLAWAQRAAARAP